MNPKIRIRRIPPQIAINAESFQIQLIPEPWLFFHTAVFLSVYFIYSSNFVAWRLLAWTNSTTFIKHII